MNKRMARRRKRTQSTVDISLRADDLARVGAALTFKVRRGGILIGTIQIGQGAIRWKGSHGQKFRRLTWTRFFEKLSRN